MGGGIEGCGDICGAPAGRSALAKPCSGRDLGNSWSNKDGDAIGDLGIVLGSPFDRRMLMPFFMAQHVVRRGL
jgi:hypothetical protein